nr:extensin-like [Penaeus vannamei]
MRPPNSTPPHPNPTKTLQTHRRPPTTHPNPPQPYLSTAHQNHPAGTQTGHPNPPKPTPTLHTHAPNLPSHTPPCANPTHTYPNKPHPNYLSDRPTNSTTSRDSTQTSTRALPSLISTPRLYPPGPNQASPPQPRVTTNSKPDMRIRWCYQEADEDLQGKLTKETIKVSLAMDTDRAKVSPRLLNLQTQSASASPE